MKREEIMKFAATYDTEGYIRACGKRNADDLTVEEVEQWYLLNSGCFAASCCVFPKYLKFMREAMTLKKRIEYYPGHYEEKNSSFMLMINEDGTIYKQIDS